MNHFNLEITEMRAAEFAAAEDVDKGVWLSLMLYCVAVENRGVIENCMEWTERQWLLTANIQQQNIIKTSTLWEWEGPDLHLWGYPFHHQHKVDSGRAGGKKGGRPPKANPPQNPPQNPPPNPKGKVREDKGKVREGAASPTPDPTPPALPESRDVDPMLVEDRKPDGKKERAAPGDPPDLAEYLGMAEAHARGNPDGFVIPPQFVRWWHGLRVSAAWEKANGVPVPNTPEARWSDLLTMARNEYRAGKLAAHGPSQSQKKKEAAARMQSLLASPPTARWVEWARENLGWQVDDDAEWSASEASARKELWAAWNSEQNKTKQAA